MSWKKPFSLSKKSNYPSSIRKVVSKKFCPKNFSSICDRKKNSMALKYLKRIEKFKVFGFFLWIPHKHWFLLSFLYIQQWLASSLDKSTKLFFWKIKKWQKLYLYEASIKEIRKPRCFFSWIVHGVWVFLQILVRLWFFYT